MRPGVREPSAHATIVIDCTPTLMARGPDDAPRIRAWRARGQRVALASKHALVADPLLLGDPGIGANAVLGGTGARLQAELRALQSRWTRLAIAASATSTLVLQVMEAGGTLTEGLDAARACGVLEPNPELDLRGDDARMKLSLVAGGLAGGPVDPHTIVVQDLRSVDPRTVQRRASEGRATRLIGRAERGGALTLAYEAVDRASPLASPRDQLVYTYELDDGTQRIHRGRGLGAEGTAAALHADAQRLALNDASA